MDCFTKWGMPKSIRIDNGKPMGDPQRKSVPPLALWLEATGVQVIFNRPRQPTDNATVERMQRTTKNWAEVKDCRDVKQLTKRLKQSCVIQRDVYKVSRMKNRTRKEVFPQLYHNKRKYNSSDFDSQKAYQRLEKWTFTRQTSAVGTFSLYSQVYYLGKAYTKQYVLAKFDTQKKEWQIFDAQGGFIKAIKTKNMEEHNIQNLTVSQRTKKK